MLVFELSDALGSDGQLFQPIIVANRTRDYSQTIQPTGYAYNHVLNHSPEVTYYTDQTTARVDNNLKWLVTTPRPITSNTARTATRTIVSTTAKPFLRSDLRKLASNEALDSGVSKSDSNESHFLNSSVSGESDSDESYESFKSKSKSKSKKKGSKEPTTTTTTTVKPLIFRPFGRFPQPQVYRIPCNIQPVYQPNAQAGINGYLQPHSGVPIPMPMPVPVQTLSSPYPPNRIIYQQRPQRPPLPPSSPFIHGPPLPFTGIVRIPTYRTFIVKTKPKEPQPNPPPHNLAKPASTDKKDTSAELGNSSSKQDDLDELKKEDHKKKKHEGSSEESHFSSEHHSSYGNEGGSAEDQGAKHTGYEVHESHEEKDHGKSNKKHGGKTATHHHGQKATAKKDVGHHGVGETGFEKEEGVSYMNDHRKHKGFHKDNKYHKADHFDKGNKGGYDEKKKTGFDEKHNGHKMSHHGGEKKYGHHDHKYHDDKGGKYTEQKLHKMGAKTNGYHNIFHKDEHHKEHTYYDKGDNSGTNFKYGDEHEQYDVKKGHGDKGAENDAGHHKAHEKKNGHVRKAHGDKKKDNWINKTNDGKSLTTDQVYGTEKQRSAKNQRSHRWK